jgi:iduronate 2-sulfatase
MILSTFFRLVYTIFIITTAVSVAVAGPPGEPPGRKMNVLFIALDDLKPELGAYGNRIVKSPAIDKLAARGTVFFNNHCQQALCGPTRASILTGKRPDYTQVWNLFTKMRDVNPDILTIPQYFAQQGYTTAGIGKVFDERCVDREQDKPSWTIPYYEVEPRYFHNAQVPAFLHYQAPETRKAVEFYRAQAAQSGLDAGQTQKLLFKHARPSTEATNLPDSAYLDGAMAIKANEILRKLAQDGKPFFFAVGYAKPHLPFVAPQKYWDMYDRKALPLAAYKQHAANSPALAYHGSEELRNYSDIPALAGISGKGVTGLRLPEEKERELVHGYYAAVSYVDTQVGKLLDELDRLGLRDNTIVILWGDHGLHLGDHDLWCKHSNFEQATRSPMIISAPGIKPSATSVPTEFVDVFPTLCQLSGLPVPGRLDGISLVPVMLHPKKKVKAFAVSQYTRGPVMGYSIRTQNHRLTYWVGGHFRSNKPFDPAKVTARELYDYKNDPGETRNLIDDKKYRKVVKIMQKQLLGFFQHQSTAGNDEADTSFK